MIVYLLFKGSDYYPSQGLGDCIGVYTDEALAKTEYTNCKVGSYEWKNLWSLDTATGELTDMT